MSKPFAKYVITPTFEKIHADTNKNIFVMGPVGSGKTSGCIWQPVFNAMRQIPDRDGVRHSRHLVCMNSYPSLKHTAMKSWREWFKDKITLTYSSPYTGRLQFALSDGTSVDMELLFMAANTDEAAEKLRSLQVTSAHIGEASNIDRGVYELIQTRVGRFPPKADGGAINPFVILDYNAVSTEHWLYKIAEEEKPEGASFYKQPPAAFREVSLNGEVKYKLNLNAENLDNLPTEYYKNIIDSSSEEAIRTNILNDYGEVRYGKPVYKEYTDSKHYVDNVWKPTYSYPIIIGCDLGLTPAATFCQQTIEGKLVVFDEIVTEDCCLEDFLDNYLIPKLKNNYSDHYNNRKFKIFVDPAARQRSSLNGRTALSLFIERRLPTSLAITNDISLRINAVDSFLRKEGRFQLAKQCPVLRKGFISGYRYGKTGTEGLYKEKPDKNFYSHVHDSLQYVMLYYQHLLKKNSNSRHFGEKPKYRAASTVGGY